MSLSIVIPTWNEAAWLPRLLTVLSTSHRPLEIVVVDNHSSDDTRSLALAFGTKLVDGGLPATGRNSGARAATGDILLFLDADVVVPMLTLEDAINTLTRQDAVAVHVRLDPITSSRFIRACYRTMHWCFVGLDRLRYPQGVGSFVLVRRNAFESIGGFAEHVAVGEDVDFFRRLGRVGRVVYLARSAVLVSPRRFRIANFIAFSAKCVLWALLRLCGSSRSLLGDHWRAYPASVADAETLA